MSNRPKKELRAQTITRTTTLEPSTHTKMKKLLLSLVLLGSLLSVHAEEPRLVQAIPLNGVEGRIDHMSMDVAGKRLFIAALGNNTVEVVDLNQGKVVRSLSGFSEPQGVRFVPEFNLLAVGNGGN